MKERLVPSALLARYHTLQALLSAVGERGVVAGGAMPRFVTPEVKAQEVLRKAGVQRVFVEDVHAALWYASRFPDLPLERALEEIDFIQKWRMVQPEVDPAWYEIQRVFETRPAVFERFQELRERRWAFEQWLGEERMDRAGLFLNASRIHVPADAVKQDFAHRYLPEALARFLERFPSAPLPEEKPFRVIHARIYPRTEAEAHAVVRHLRDHPPKHPHRTVVALGNPGLFPLMERVLTDYGIPFIRPGGPFLVQFPVFHLLDAGLAFVEYASPENPDDVPQNILQRIQEEPALKSPKLEEARKNLVKRYANGADPEGRLPVSGWISLMETWMEEALRWVDHPRYREARERLHRLLEELRFAVETGGDPRLAPRSFRLLLHRFARKFRVPEEDAGGGVCLASFPDDVPFEGERLYVVGLSEHALPSYPYHPWVPLRHVHRFGWLPPQDLYERQKRQFERILKGYDDVWLSSSRLDDEDRQVAPSPVLLPFLQEAPAEREVSVTLAYFPWDDAGEALPELPEGGVELSPSEREDLKKRLQNEGLRVTDLVDYGMCPFRFYLRVVEKVPEIQLPEALPSRLDVGDLFHRAYETALKPWEGKDLPSPSVLLERVKSAIPQMLAGLSPMDQALFGEELLALAERMVDLEARLGEMGYRRLVSLEGSGVTEVAGVPLRGRWDRVVASPGGEELVLDYKTGSVPYGRRKSAAMLQLEAYVAMRDRAKSAVFLYPREGQMVFLEPNRELFLEDVMTNILEGRFPTTDAPDEVCRSCPFNRICPVGREHMPSWS